MLRGGAWGAPVSELIFIKDGLKDIYDVEVVSRPKNNSYAFFASLEAVEFEGVTGRVSIQVF